MGPGGKTKVRELGRSIYQNKGFRDTKRTGLKVNRLSPACGIILFLIFYPLVACGLISAKTVYYAPVVHSSGEKIAYVKRIVSYSASGGSIIPFLGGTPTRVHVRKDRIQLCEKRLSDGRETIVEDWKITLATTRSLGLVQPKLDWSLDKLRYVIWLSHYGDIGLGKPHPSHSADWILTNTENWSRLRHGPEAAGGIKIGLSSTIHRFPASNKLIAEKTWDARIELPKIKKKMQARLDQQLIELDSTQPKLEESNAAEIKRARRLLAFINAQKPNQLPQSLAALFLEELILSSGDFPDLSPFIIFLGEAGVRPLVEIYPQAPAQVRRKILILLGDMGSTVPLSLFRDEIHSDNLDLRKAAVAGIRKIKGDRALEELYLILGATAHDPLMTHEILLQLKQVDDPNWHATLLRHALKDRTLFELLPSVVPDLEDFPEEVVWHNLPLIFKRLQEDSQPSCDIAQQLVLAIRHPNMVADLYPILEDTLKVCFDYGKTLRFSEGHFKSLGREEANPCIFDRHLASTMLGRFEKELTKNQFVNWYAMAHKNPKSQLNMLFIEHMYLAKGGRMVNRPPIKSLIEINVHDSEGTLLSSARHVMILGKKTTFEGKSMVSGYPEYMYEGRLVLDPIHWRLKMDAFTIRMRPQDVSFPVAIPFGGACETLVAGLFRGKHDMLRWTIRHIDGS